MAEASDMEHVKHTHNTVPPLIPRESITCSTYMTNSGVGGSVFSGVGGSVLPTAVRAVRPSTIAIVFMIPSFLSDYRRVNPRLRNSTLFRRLVNPKILKNHFF